MGYIAKGLYRELLDEAWIEGSLPNDMSELADICDCPVDVMYEQWPRILVCWQLNENGRWVNDKLESLRTEVDAIRVTKAEAGRLGGLMKIRNAIGQSAVNVRKLDLGLADAKHVLADASGCHIEEKRREEKSKRRKEPSGDKPPVDDRHHPFRLAIVEAWPDGEPPWNGREGSALSKLLAANPRLTLEGFKRLLKHRRDSEGVNLTARPFGWLEKVTDFASGPLDRYGKPLTPTPQAPVRRYANEVHA